MPETIIMCEEPGQPSDNRCEEPGQPSDNRYEEPGKPSDNRCEEPGQPSDNNRCEEPGHARDNCSKGPGHVLDNSSSEGPGHISDMNTNEGRSYTPENNSRGEGPDNLSGSGHILDNCNRCEGPGHTQENRCDGLGHTQDNRCEGSGHTPGDQREARRRMSKQWVGWRSVRAAVQGQWFLLPRVKRQLTVPPLSVDSMTLSGRSPLYRLSGTPRHYPLSSKRRRAPSPPTHHKPTSLTHDTEVVQRHDNPTFVHDLQPCGPSRDPQPVVSGSRHSQHPPAGDGRGLSRRNTGRTPVLLSPRRYLQDSRYLSHPRWLAWREKHSTSEPSSYHLPMRKRAQLTGTKRRIKAEMARLLTVVRQKKHETGVSQTSEERVERPEAPPPRVPTPPSAAHLTDTPGQACHLEPEWRLTPELGAKEAAEELRCVREMQAPLHLRRCQTMHLKQVYKVGTGRAWEAQPSVVRLMRGGGRTFRGVLTSVQMPTRFLNYIAGRYGASGAAVFSFTKDLILLNLVLSLVLFSSLVAPALYQTLVLGKSLASTEGWTTQQDPAMGDNCSNVMPIHNNPKVRNCSLIYQGSLGGDNSTRWWNQTGWISDLLLGEGRLEHTLLFLGHYPVTMLHDIYPTAAVQVLAVVTVFLVSLVMVVSRVGQWLRYNSDIWGGLIFSKIVFTGWDFSLKGKSCTKSKRRILTTEIRAALDEHGFQRSKSERTGAQLACLYVTRVAVNCVVLVAVLLGCIIIIFVTEHRQCIEEWVDELPLQDAWQTETLMSIISYLDTLTVWLLGLVLPPVFRWLGSLEQFSSRVSMLLFLLRNATVRLASLGALVASNLILVASDSSEDCRPDIPCWETTLAQNLYSQVVWDFAMRVVTNVLLLIHRILTLPFSCKEAMLDFDVPGRVLDILSLQTIVWLSVPVSPLVPVLVLASMYFSRWMDVLVALLITKPSKHVYQVSHSSAMFMVVLAVSWVGAAAMTVVVFVFIRPSLGCGPFRGMTVAWDALTHYICNLHGSMAWLRNILFALDDLRLTVSVGMALVLATLYYLWLLQLRLAIIKQLEKRLKDISQEKVFLMKRRQKLLGHHTPTSRTKIDRLVLGEGAV